MKFIQMRESEEMQFELGPKEKEMKNREAEEAEKTWGMIGREVEWRRALVYRLLQ